MKRFILIAISALAGCQHHPETFTRPHVNTAAVGVDLDSLGKSLGSAQESISSVRTNLSAVDDKAVKIHNLIHTKRP
jgi:hypothetical protein